MQSRPTISQKRGLSMLKAAGIQAIIDHHALPGVAAVNQMFAGNCTSNVQFYVRLGDGGHCYDNILHVATDDS